MRAIIVNPEESKLSEMTECIKSIHQDYEIVSFTDSMMAYKYAFNNAPIDIVYTVVEMKRLDGFSLARMMRDDNPDISIVLFSENETHKKDAERFGCDCFLAIPFTSGELLHAETEND